MVSDSILFPVPTEMVTLVTSDPNCHQQYCINAPVPAPLLLLPDKLSWRFIRSECLGHRTQWDRLHWVQPVCFSEFCPRVHCRSGAHSGNWPAHQQREESAPAPQRCCHGYDRSIRNLELVAACCLTALWDMSYQIGGIMVYEDGFREQKKNPVGFQELLSFIKFSSSFATWPVNFDQILSWPWNSQLSFKVTYRFRHVAKWKD